MKITRKAIAVLLCIIMVVAFSACGKQEEPLDDENETTTSSIPTENTTAAAATTQITSAAATDTTAAITDTTAAVTDTTAPVVTDTTAGVTEATASVPQVTESTTQPTTAPTTQEETTLSEADIMADNISKMCAAVNTAKHTQNFSAVKTQKVSFEIVDCSVELIIPAANKIIQKLAHDNVKEYNFVNGYSKNPKEGQPDVTPAEAIPPTNKDIMLDPAGITMLDVKQEGNNTVYTAIIGEEVVSIDNQEPYYHAMAIDYINLAEYDIKPAELTKADITYHNATIRVSVDNTTGLLSGFEETTPITSVGSAKLLGFTTDGTIEGNLYESWTFNW